MKWNFLNFRFFHELIAFIIGCFLTLSFAPFNIFPIAIISPSILLFLWLSVSNSRAFWIGFWFGVGFFSTCIYWIFIGIHGYGNTPFLLALAITSLVIAFLSLYPACNGYVLNRYFINKKTKILYAFPATWVFFEWIRSLLLTGFPCGLLGYSQMNSFLKGYAPIFSVYGVSLAVVLTSALIVFAILQFRQKQFNFYLCLIAIFCIWSTGGILTYIQWTKPSDKLMKISLVQANITADKKWLPRQFQFTLDQYNHLTESHWDSDIIVWPETALTIPMDNMGGVLDELSSKAKKHNTAIIIGIPIKSNHPDEFYNGIITLGNGEGIYKKRHLLPFGEYIPLRDTFEYLLGLKVPLSNFISGNLSAKPLLANGLKIAPLICYEITYPELVLFRDNTIGMILTVTNDGWFGHSTAAAQHLQIAQMRALELGRPVLFVANNGMTAIINSAGKIQSSIPQFKSDVLTDKVQPYQGQTPWQRYGMYPILGILLGMLFIAIMRSNFWRE